MDNPYAVSTVDSTPNSPGRSQPVREGLFLAALSLVTWGAVMFNDSLSVMLYSTAVVSLGLAALVFAIWGCWLAVLLNTESHGRSKNVIAGVLVAVGVAVGTGLVMVVCGNPPHGLLLPIAVIFGSAVSYVSQRRYAATSGGDTQNNPSSNRQPG